MDFPRDFGPYRLLKQIAMGGMAEIVLAKTKGFGGFEKLLALKMIHPKFSQDEHFINMLIEEAKICVELDHVNIGQVFDLGKLDETYFISMEFIEGADIFKIMRRATEIDYEIPIETCAHIGQEICAGLDYAHNKRDSEGRPLGIIHRDISPQNVLISYAGEVKIVDFGIAKAGVRAQETEVGVIKGKYYYMSPEQAWGDPVDHRTDIFSAGIIVYEMLTGQMLYLEENIELLLDRVRKAEIAPPSSLRREIPAELDDIVMKALAKRPEDRWQSAQEMSHALGGFLYGFSPDFTSARLASMLAWLFDEEAHQEPLPAAADHPDASLLLTRNDFSKAPPKKTGSLLYELADLQEIAAPLLDGERSDASSDSPTLDAALRQGAFEDDDDPTSQVRLPDLLADVTARVETRTDSNDATMRLELPDMMGDLDPFLPDGPGDTHDLRAFGPGDTHDNRTSWDDSTAVESPAEMLQHLRDDAPTDRSPAKSPNRRQAHELTRPIDTGSLTDVAPPAPAPRKERNSSYLPPPPPPGMKPPAAPPAATYKPPRPSRPPQPPPDEDDGAGLDAPMTEASAPPEKMEARAPSVAPPPPQRPSAPAFKPPPVVSAPPSKASTTPEPSRDDPSPPARPEVPPAAPPSRPATTPSKPSARPPSASSEAQDTRPALLSEQQPHRDDSQQTALIPESLQLQPRTHDETGPTNVAHIPREIRADRATRDRLPHLAPEDQTNPTRVLPQAAERGHQTRRPDEQPQATRELPSPAEAQRDGAFPTARQPAGRGGEVRRTDPPPWLIGGDGLSGATNGRRPAGPSPSAPLEPEVLSAPPEQEDILAMKRQASLWPRARKLVLPVAGALLLVILVVALWPRPAPVSMLDIRSHPPGAEIYIDGERQAAVTPTKIENLPQGSVHHVELRLEGFTPWSQPVELNSEEVRQIAVLSPIRGTLRVTSEPRGASVFIDGMYQGSAPVEVEGLDINREVDVQCRFEDQTRHETVVWGGRTEATVHFTFEIQERRRRYR